MIVQEVWRRYDSDMLLLSIVVVVFVAGWQQYSGCWLLSRNPFSVAQVTKEFCNSCTYNASSNKLGH